MNYGILNLVCIGAGGFIGAVSRYLVSCAVLRHFPSAINLGTLCVNVLGSLVIGIIFSVTLYTAPVYLKNLAVAGFLGGFTTFSTFSLDSFKLILQGSFASAVLYIALNLILGIAACALGYYCGRHLLHL